MAAYMQNVPLMLAFSAIASLGMSPLQGTLNALIAEASEYTWLRTGKRIDGLLFSCTSLGVKIGSGLGTAASGWLLQMSGYHANMEVQPDSAIQMLYVMYVIILLLLTRLDVEKATARFKEQADAMASGGSVGQPS